MTPKERWLAAVRRERPDRVPMTYRATTEATKKLVEHLGCRNPAEMLDRLHVDLQVNVGPRYVGPAIPKDRDMYGRGYQDMPYEGGVYRECVVHPLAGYETLEEIKRSYVWPSADWFDHSDLPKQVEGQEDRVIAGGGSEPFLLYKDLRGEEQAFMDLVLHPDIVHFCMDRLYGFCHENTRRIYERIPGKVTVTSVAEDMGAQNGLLYSREHLRTYFFPHMRRMIGLAHEAGALVNTHSDGAIREILPDLIEMGVDLINPIQWRCRGMDREGLKRDFGDRLAFEGGWTISTRCRSGRSRRCGRRCGTTSASWARAGGTSWGRATTSRSSGRRRTWWRCTRRDTRKARVKQHFMIRGHGL